MKTSYVTAALCATVAVPMVAIAAPPAAAPTAVIPPAPVLPRNLSFNDELVGRRTLLSARDTYRNAPSTSYAAKWTLTTGNAPGTKPTVYSGTETVYIASPERKLSLTAETTLPSQKTVRRAIANGQEMLVTRFEQSGANVAEATREFIRVPLDEGVSLTRALYQAQFTPAARASQMMLDPNWTIRSDALWREARRSVNGVSVDVINEQDKPAGNQNRSTIRARRYWVQADTHRLLRYEEWTTVQGQARPARRNTPADNGLRVTYRREDYTSLKPATATTWSQALPNNYKEQPLPEVRLPELEPPTNEKQDPRALALLKKWRSAQERFLSYSANIDLSLRSVQRTAQSRPLPDSWNGSSSRYIVTLRRPGQTRIEALALEKGGVPNVPESMIAVSDGKQVRVIDQNRGRNRTMEMDNPAALWGYLNRAGMGDPWGALSVLFNQPPAPDNYGQVRYEGTSTSADGEPVEVITLLRQDVNERRGRRQVGPVETTFETRIALGMDGLPREMTIKRKNAISGAFERDQPPITTMTALYRNIRVDGEPASTAFVLPRVAERR
jgi:hypothetical protein